ncbi:MAG: TRAP transporter substrate-binding protein [Candidatus Adiutrix sp.]|jgi:TRAP-type C4-dicarboxylate transport system substrate-binding protein|nr:TRAP transporter substrate-binding protein [Candidatus Adiutrix sp.]
MKRFVIALAVLGLASAFVPGPGAFAEEAKIRLILASSGNEGDNFAHVTFAKFMELVEQKAPGAFDIQYRPGMAMGDEPETVRLVQSGSIEMATLLSNTMATFAPSAGWMNMPYFFEDRESFHAAALGMWDTTNELMIKESGCRVIAINEIGFRNLTTNAKSRATNLEEAARLKIRLPASAQGLALYDALGLTPVTVSFAETFGALAQGVVDGQESAYSLVTLKKFYEVQKYALDIETGLHVGFIVASEKWLEGLPEHLRAAVLEAGREATVYEFEIVAPEYLIRDRAIMTEAGMEFLGRPADFDQWRERGRRSWPANYKIIGGGDEAAGRALVEKAASYLP